MEKLRIWMFSAPDGHWERNAMSQAVLDVVEQMNLDDQVVLNGMVVDTEELAVQRRVYGLPSIKIDGIDVEQDIMMYEPFGTWKRTYRQGAHVSGRPTPLVIREALIDALAWRRHRQFAAKSTT